MYPEMYLSDAMENLGAMCEYVASDLHMDLNEFWLLFIASGLAGEIAKGNCVYVAGHSGVELAMETFRKTGYWESNLPRPGIYFDRSAYYWAGWILAYYQWHSGYSFTEIQKKLPMSQVIDMYHIYHEMSEYRVAEKMDLIMGEKTLETENEYIVSLQDNIRKIKSSRKMEGRFMTLEDMLKEEHKEGLEEGREEERKNIMSVLSALKAGKTIDDLKEMGHDPELLLQLESYMK